MAQQIDQKPIDTRGRCGDLVAYVSECGRRRELLPAEPPRSGSSSGCVPPGVPCGAIWGRGRRCTKRLRLGASPQQSSPSARSQASISAVETAYSSEMQSTAPAGATSEFIGFACRTSCSERSCHRGVADLFHVSRGESEPSESKHSRFICTRDASVGVTMHLVMSDISATLCAWVIRSWTQLMKVQKPSSSVRWLFLVSLEGATGASEEGLQDSRMLAALRRVYFAWFQSKTDGQVITAGDRARWSTANSKQDGERVMARPHLVIA